MGQFPATRDMHLSLAEPASIAGTVLTAGDGPGEVWAYLPKAEQRPVAGPSPKSSSTQPSSREPLPTKPGDEIPAPRRAEPITRAVHPKKWHLYTAGATALALGAILGFEGQRLGTFAAVQNWAERQVAWVGSKLQSGHKDVVGWVQNLRGGAKDSRPQLVDADPVSASDRSMATFTVKLDEMRLNVASAARDFGNGMDGLRGSVERSGRELSSKFNEVDERLERVEKLLASLNSPRSSHAGPSPVGPALAVESSPAAQPTVAGASRAARKFSVDGQRTEPQPSRNWTVVGTSRNGALLRGPNGTVSVSVGDTLPSLGRVTSIAHWGPIPVVTTTKGLLKGSAARTALSETRAVSPKQQ